MLAREGLAALSYQELLEFERIAELLGYPRSINPLDHSVSPRGYRVLANIPRLPSGVIERVVGDMDGLDADRPGVPARPRGGAGGRRRRGPATSARVSAGSRSTISSTGICSSDGRLIGLAEPFSHL